MQVPREQPSSAPLQLIAPPDDGPSTTDAPRAASISPPSTPRPGTTNGADGAFSNMSGVSDAIEAIASASSLQSPPPKRSRGSVPNEVDSWDPEPTGSPPASPMSPDLRVGPSAYVPSPEV